MTLTQEEVRLIIKGLMGLIQLTNQEIEIIRTLIERLATYGN